MVAPDPKLDLLACKAIRDITDEFVRTAKRRMGNIGRKVSWRFNGARAKQLNCVDFLSECPHGQRRVMAKARKA
jgi:hypothetical protein